MGTGEGAQYRGWGAYGAERRGIAEGYREALTAKHNPMQDERIRVVYGGDAPDNKILNDLTYRLRSKGHTKASPDQLLREYTDNTRNAIRTAEKEIMDPRELAREDVIGSYNNNATMSPHYKGPIESIDEAPEALRANLQKRYDTALEEWTAQQRMEKAYIDDLYRELRALEKLDPALLRYEKPKVEKGYTYEWDIPDDVFDNKFLDLDADLVDQPRDVAELLAKVEKLETRPMPGGFYAEPIEDLNELGKALEGMTGGEKAYHIKDSLGRRVETVTPKWQNADEFTDEYFASMQRAGIDDVMDRDFIKGNYKPLHEERVAQWNQKTGADLDTQARQAEGTGWDWYLDLVNGLRGGHPLRNIPPNDPHARIVSEEILGGEGIPGLKFLDNPSRPRQTTPERQTRNVVVWDESLLKALRRHDD